MPPLVIEYGSQTGSDVGGVFVRVLCLMSVPGVIMFVFVRMQIRMFWYVQAKELLTVLQGYLSRMRKSMSSGDRPDGELVYPYCRNVSARQGRHAGTTPLALNDPPGVWTLTVRDVLTGLSESVEVNVDEPTP